MKKFGLLLLLVALLAGCGVQENKSEVIGDAEVEEVVEETVAEEKPLEEVVEETEVTDVEEVIIEEEKEPYIAEPGRLRALADEKGMHVGTAIDLKYIGRELYADSVKNDFNTIVMENMMKMASMNPNQDKYLFSGVDVAANFAKEYDMDMRGHTLVWHQQLPLWLTQKSGQWTKEELLTIIENYVENVVGHFKGTIYTWDVLNEIIEEDGTFRESMWYKYTGEDYISVALRKAREVDPEATLIINDYSVETLNDKSDGLYNLVKGLQEDGVPIDGVGFQCHFIADQIDYDSMIANIDRFQALGLEVQLTEIDLRIESPVTDEKLVAQGEAYKRLMEICIEKDITTFVVWGVNDGLSWVPGFFVGYSTPLLLDRNYEQKPAYQGVYDALNQYSEE